MKPPHGSSPARCGGAQVGPTPIGDLRHPVVKPRLRRTALRQDHSSLAPRRGAEQNDCHDQYGENVRRCHASPPSPKYARGGDLPAWRTQSKLGCGAQHSSRAGGTGRYAVHLHRTSATRRAVNTGDRSLLSGTVTNRCCPHGRGGGFGEAAGLSHYARGGAPAKKRPPEWMPGGRFVFVA